MQPVLKQGEKTYTPPNQSLGDVTKFHLHYDCFQMLPWQQRRTRRDFWHFATKVAVYYAFHCVRDTSPDLSR